MGICFYFLQRSRYSSVNNISTVVISIDIVYPNANNPTYILNIFSNQNEVCLGSCLKIMQIFIGEKKKMKRFQRKIYCVICYNATKQRLIEYMYRLMSTCEDLDEGVVAVVHTVVVAALGEEVGLYDVTVHLLQPRRGQVQQQATAQDVVDELLLQYQDGNIFFC